MLHTNFFYRLIYHGSRIKLIKNFPKNLLLPSLFSLSACNQKEIANYQESLDGLDGSYIPPKSDYTDPISKDFYQFSLMTDLVEPYWVEALLMDKWESQITGNLQSKKPGMKYLFPKSEPDYNDGEVFNWTAASFLVETGSQNIFTKLNEVLEVQFRETSTLDGTNVIAIAQSEQLETLGLSYLPNNFLKLVLMFSYPINFPTPVLFLNI